MLKERKKANMDEIFVVNDGLKVYPPRRRNTRQRATLREQCVQFQIYGDLVPIKYSSKNVLLLIEYECVYQ